MRIATTRTIVGTGAFLLSLVAFPARAREAGPIGVRQRAAVASAAPESAARDDRWSLYDLGATWRDQAGAERTLASLRGRPQLVAMVYTHCSTTCPLTVADMKRVERALGDRAGYVLVSLDPARDTTAQLAAWARAHALDARRWTLLGGAEGDVRALAAALGTRYRRLSPAELAHSNALTVLDADGAIAWQGTRQGDADAAIAALRQLSAR